MEIIIGADIVPTKSNINLFDNADIDKLIGNDLKILLNNSDFTCFNLEVPLIDKLSPIEKCGPNLIAPTSSIKGLKTINPYFFTLANNHILDQGIQGLTSTMNLLKDNNIAFAGAGNNIKEASKPYVFEKSGIKVGIYCCAEYEFSIATETLAGANPFDPLESLDHINKLKEKCDYVIVLYHGGKEHYRYPSPYLQKICRKIVEKGADIVICQHSHCIGCEEIWKDGRIIYGQGNFLFDNSDSEFWQTSLLIKINLDIKNNKNKISYIPLIKKDNKVRIANTKQATLIMEDFFKRSEEIYCEDFVKINYKKFAKSMQWQYLSAFSGKFSKNIFYRIINKLTKNNFVRFYIGRRYSPKERIVIENFIQCEAHRELILEGLRDKINEQ
ncbi:CapA family protein [Clostridium perfringens]|uniref:CapA family protein n=1 Tax=Clostridium perfringens TaxID=1502 RepID=UPI0001666000|nr:CapA family protein [Clostridium perfringens]AXH51540.1 CapA family protein [Clostridium perfringens]EDS80967.1 putative poly-gamma-glutamate synthesis protein [Clostridium perfringens C str. JGS1495]MBI6030580.1 CapA family protein [Clostridium perfringens]MBI6033844.1 CapA family protein [Clostridium perfringens]NGT46716.1 CapA family protein [Clostridium perfringens]